MQYLSCAATAALVRKSLREAFAATKFTVRTNTYAGGASINIGWTDGPNAAQVDAIVRRFRGSYFDGSIDYKGTVYAMLDGLAVQFGADHVFLNRSYSDAWVQRVTARVRSVFRSAGDYGVRVALAKHTDSMRVAASKTAGRVFVTHDDGYSRDCGSGMSAVHVEDTK